MVAVSEGGSFAEYCLADAHILIKIPESLSFEDAAGVGMAGLTASQALWQNQDLPTPLNPVKEPFPVRTFWALSINAVDRLEPRF